MNDENAIIIAGLGFALNLIAFITVWVKLGRIFGIHETRLTAAETNIDENKSRIKDAENKTNEFTTEMAVFRAELKKDFEYLKDHIRDIKEWDEKPRAVRTRKVHE